MQYKVAIKMHAPITSITECCFKNTVEIQIKIQVIKEQRLIILWSSIALHFTRAIWIASELYTWILGNTLVGVSVAYIVATVAEKILSLGKTVGLMFKPFGYTVQINIATDIPIIKDRANFRYSEFVPLKNIYIQDAAI